MEVVYALWRRDMVKLLRDRRSLITSLTRPFLWLLAFGFGLRASVQLAGTETDFVSFLVPGIAAMTVLFGSMFAAISIVWEREFGFLKELLVAPVPRSSIVIGIGAGPECDGQVMVMHDLLGLEPSWKPRFVRRYAELGKAAGDAFAAYTADVRAGRFPGPQESFD
jgi:hypothetical protein